MAHPLKDNSAPTTPFGARGYHWSCRKDASGRGIHTGADWARSTGTPVYAVVEGDVRYRNYGSAFGLQLSVSPDSPGEWFYAHLSWRVKDGTRVKAGDLVGRIGSTGNSTGPHLHLEWHPDTKQTWNCSVHADPWAEIKRIGGSTTTPSRWMFPSGHKVYAKYLKFNGHEQNPDNVSDSIKALQEMLNRHSLKGGQTLPVTGKYWTETDEEVRLCQQQHGFGSDKPGESFVGPKQLAHLIETTNCPYDVVPVKETDPDDTKVEPWLSKAAEQMRDEIDAIFPNRDKRTDGWIGDANHTTGEHVPDKSTGVVRAIDVDADLDQRNANASQQLADLLLKIGREKKDRGRLYYVIHNGKIASGTYEDKFWTWRPYDGSNPHTSHIHVSFKPKGDEDGTAWDLMDQLDAPDEPTEPEKPPTPDPDTECGCADELADLQAQIDDLRADVDTIMGEPTEPEPEKPNATEVTAITFNWPARYKNGGKGADEDLWDELSKQCTVFGAQEAHWAWNNIIKDEKGWTHFNPRRSDGSFTGEILSWKNSTWETLDMGSTLLSPATVIQEEAAGPTKHGEKWIVWADLRHRVTGETWYFANVHFVPSKHLGGAAFNLWVAQRNALIAWILRQGQNTVVLGDFNGQWSDKVAAPFHEVARVQDAVSHGKRKIDWVLRKKGVARVGGGTALPNRGQSDHRPVKATVKG